MMPFRARRGIACVSSYQPHARYRQTPPPFTAEALTPTSIPTVQQIEAYRSTTGTLRRVFSECGIERGFDFRDASKEMAAKFPPPLRSLRVTSQAGLARHLQHRAPLPLGAAYIRWYGPWVGRWSGRDSDLFFVFTKHFHQLVSEHIPENTGLSSMACIPGFVPVLSQVLTVLESTIYRQAGQANSETFASGTVDDVNNPDAIAPIPMTIANAARSMAENRLIMLLRDVTGDKMPGRHHLRNVYLRSFNSILKAACRKISVYNNDACFVLCDFMEEVLPLMSRYQSSHPDSTVLDWYFWLKVRHLLPLQACFKRLSKCHVV